MNLLIVIQIHGYTQNDFSHAQEPNARTNPTHFQDTTNTQNYEDDVRRKEENLYYQQQLQNAREQAYHDAYIQDLKNRGYRIRYKKTFKDYVKDFIALVIFVLILVLLWQIPFVKNFFIDFYNSNAFLQSIVQMFKNLI